MDKERQNIEAIEILCKEYSKNNMIDPGIYKKFDIKRGLRNNDGSGVVAGVTQICNVHGYIMNEGEREAVPGALYYRGYDLNDLIASCEKEERFGFEEVIYLLIFGVLPNRAQLAHFTDVVVELMRLPTNFVEDMMLKAPSPNIMNKLARSILALYSYDSDPENMSLESEMGKALQLIGKTSNLMVKGWHVKQRHYAHESLYIHLVEKNLSIAENILSMLRIDRKFEREEALLLDLCMMMHAEHGGGNNSTFTCRVLTSSGTDAYSTYAAAIGSLKGPKHGGANNKVLSMLDNIKENVENINDREQVIEYLKKIIRKEAFDGAGLIYGMGHAVYTISDPRAIILKRKSTERAKGTEWESDLNVLNIIDEETPRIFKEIKGNDKAICSNVDLYSGLVYKMLGIPQDLFTPLFAASRISGWAAHRMEELFTCNRIIRPAYKAICGDKVYTALDNRE